MGRKVPEIREDAEADLTIWKEALFGAELLLLHASPVFYGLGVPHGNGAGVVTIPGFLGSDFYLNQLQTWLKRIGYTPYVSGIPINAECPNLLIQRCLGEAIEKARKKTRRKVHLIGHSLGGVIARSIACQRPEDIASVITIAAPFRGAVTHQTVRQIAENIRKLILKEHSKDVLPDCYTSRCTCDFLNSLRCRIPRSVVESAIYTRDDGIVDWRCCVTEDPKVDFEVCGTHIGLVFNASVYRIISERLGYAESLHGSRVA